MGPGLFHLNMFLPFPRDYHTDMHTFGAQFMCTEFTSGPESTGNDVAATAWRRKMAIVMG